MDEIYEGMMSIFHIVLSVLAILALVKYLQDNS